MDANPQIHRLQRSPQLNASLLDNPHFQQMSSSTFATTPMKRNAPLLRNISGSYTPTTRAIPFPFIMSNHHNDHDSDNNNSQIHHSSYTASFSLTPVPGRYHTRSYNTQHSVLDQDFDNFSLQTTTTTTRSIDHQQHHNNTNSGLHNTSSNKSNNYAFSIGGRDNDDDDDDDNCEVNFSTILQKQKNDEQIQINQVPLRDTISTGSNVQQHQKQPGAVRRGRKSKAELEERAKQREAYKQQQIAPFLELEKIKDCIWDTWYLTSDQPYPRTRDSMSFIEQLLKKHPLNANYYQYELDHYDDYIALRNEIPKVLAPGAILDQTLTYNNPHKILFNDEVDDDLSELFHDLDARYWHNQDPANQLLLPTLDWHRILDYSILPKWSHWKRQHEKQVAQQDAANQRQYELEKQRMPLPTIESATRIRKPPSARRGVNNSSNSSNNDDSVPATSAGKGGKTNSNISRNVTSSATTKRKRRANDTSIGDDSDDELSNNDDTEKENTLPTPQVKASTTNTTSQRVTRRTTRGKGALGTESPDDLDVFGTKEANLNNEGIVHKSHRKRQKTNDSPNIDSTNITHLSSQTSNASGQIVPLLSSTTLSIFSPIQINDPQTSIDINNLTSSKDISNDEVDDDVYTDSLVECASYCEQIAQTINHIVQQHKKRTTTTTMNNNNDTGTSTSSSRIHKMISDLNAMLEIAQDKLSQQDNKNNNDTY